VESSLLLKWTRDSVEWQGAETNTFIGAPIWQKNAALPLPLDACRRGARQLAALRNAGAAPAPERRIE
jgi:hypothetical protein